MGGGGSKRVALDDKEDDPQTRDASQNNKVLNQKNELLEKRIKELETNLELGAYEITLSSRLVCSFV